MGSFEDSLVLFLHKIVQELFDKTVKKSRFYNDFKYFFNFIKIIFFSEQKCPHSVKWGR